MLLGAALARARVVPTWSAWALALTSPLTILAFPLHSTIVIYLVCAVKRRQLFWELGTLQYEHDELAFDYNNAPVTLLPLSAQEKTNIERLLLGISTGEHVMAQFAGYLSKQGILGSAALEQCAEGSEVQAAGLLVVHQAPPSAKGFHCLSIEDQAGMMNVIVKPDVYISYRRVLREAPLLLVKGTIQRQGSVVNLVAKYIDSLPLPVSA